MGRRHGRQVLLALLADAAHPSLASGLLCTSGTLPSASRTLHRRPLHAGPSHPRLEGAQRGVRKLHRRQQRGHIALIAVAAEALVQQEVKQAMHAQATLKGQQRLGAVQRHSRLHDSGGHVGVGRQQNVGTQAE